jgi:tetratricopeptide (TPR) repeat protein
VSIVGQPGIGKSRLKIEIRETLPDGIRWLEGRCQSFTRSTSYSPLIEVLRSAFGVAANDAQPIDRTKLRAAVCLLPGTQAEQHAAAFATSHPLTTPFARTYIIQVRALLHLADGRLDEALAAARQAIDLAVQSRFRLEQGAAHRVLGQVLDAAGDREQASAALAKSLEIFEEIQSLPELGQPQLAYGRYMLRDESAEARGLIVRARHIFARIGATGWVAEADAALAD